MRYFRWSRLSYWLWIIKKHPLLDSLSLHTSSKSNLEVGSKVTICTKVICLSSYAQWFCKFISYFTFFNFIFTDFFRWIFSLFLGFCKRGVKVTSYGRLHRGGLFDFIVPMNNLHIYYNNHNDNYYYDNFCYYCHHCYYYQFMFGSHRGGLFAFIFPVNNLHRY